jgi:uroporphyrinogen III methyltransferase/synthase
VSTAVTVVTGRVGTTTGSSEDREPDWTALAAAGGTLVILMGAARRGEIAGHLLDGGRDPATPVAVIERGTTPSERILRTTLAEVGALEVEAPAVIVVGDVAALDLARGSEPAPASATPLQGVGVIVTRPSSQAGPLLEALRAVGAQPIGLPCIEIEEPEDGGAALAAAVGRCGGYDWVAFTSSNAVAAFFDHSRDARTLRTAQVAAVGDATRRGLSRRGVVADLVPETADGASLAAAIGPPPGVGTGRILLPQAADALPTLGEGLRALGWDVDEVEAYRTQPINTPVDDATAQLLAHAGVLTFTSPSAVRAYVGRRDRRGELLPIPLMVACIGPTTAAAAESAGMTVAVIPTTPSTEALATAIIGARNQPLGSP